MSSKSSSKSSSSEKGRLSRFFFSWKRNNKNNNSNSSNNNQQEIPLHIETTAASGETQPLLSPSTPLTTDSTFQSTLSPTNINSSSGDGGISNSSNNNKNNLKKEDSTKEDSNVVTDTCNDNQSPQTSEGCFPQPFHHCFGSFISDKTKPVLLNSWIAPILFTVSAILSWIGVTLHWIGMSCLPAFQCFSSLATYAGAIFGIVKVQTTLEEIQTDVKSLKTDVKSIKEDLQTVKEGLLKVTEVLERKFPDKYEDVSRKKNATTATKQAHDTANIV